MQRLRFSAFSTKQLQFICYTILKAFARKGNLNRHVKTIHIEHQVSRQKLDTTTTIRSCQQKENQKIDDNYASIKFNIQLWELSETKSNKKISKQLNEDQQKIDCTDFNYIMKMIKLIGIQMWIFKCIYRVSQFYNEK